ncbi:hypothetical protein T4B_1995 [Trichinella pseudospiralis]|uniref:Uncharacterized protein n=1 Tax=Trichinella pseudospiralis TaxID=6337 RepID=A0A0V1IC10_TRIPS|nr:hypothetical protein T4A_12904 [Trichinella pseudospiralis]KRZ20376.1 hypothetical protein T4B_1995 [Trichinella pseudospiralis]KRZ38778.1 hypothetical protein T4C_3240 [Trichinella pseudospiralis]
MTKNYSNSFILFSNLSFSLFLFIQLNQLTFESEHADQHQMRIGKVEKGLQSLRMLVQLANFYLIDEDHR